MAGMFYQLEDVAKRIHRSPRWLNEWLLNNTLDPETGEPLYSQAGRTKLFRAEDVIRIFDLILTQQEQAAERPKATQGYIYFIEGGHFIKIGFSRSMEARLKKMSTDAPGELRLLHIEPGTFKTEKIIHRHFAELRQHGEWFRRAPPLLQYIAERRRIAAGAA